jgi:hypothetical protein
MTIRLWTGQAAATALEIQPRSRRAAATLSQVAVILLRLTTRAWMELKTRGSGC